jgi:hypothetical protein
LALWKGIEEKLHILCGFESKLINKIETKTHNELIISRKRVPELRRLIPELHVRWPAGAPVLTFPFIAVKVSK